MSDNDLQKQIDTALAEHARKHERTGRIEGQASGMALGFKLATEFFVGPVVGAAIGWGLDLVFQTKPWMLIIWLLFGFAAGILNVVRAVKAQNDSGNGPDEGVGSEP